MASVSVSSRGRKKIEQQWCHIVDADKDQEGDITISSINLDKQMPTLKAELPKLKTKHQWKPLFSSKEFMEDQEEIRVQDFTLKDRALKRHGTEITETRKAIKQKAKLAADKAG